MQPARVFMGVRSFCAASAPLFAQQSITGASVAGRVLDPSGGVISGATVVAHHVERNQEQVAVANADGEYRFLLLPIGDYEFTARAPGFAPRTIPVTLALGEALVVPIALALETVTATVDVAAEAPVMDARRTQASTVVTPADIDALPLNGRN